QRGAELKERAENEAVHNVELLGMLNADQLRDEYRQTDIFLFPSAWEGSPKVILEAAACGLPVIARNNYSPETVLHGTTGYQAASDEELYGFLKALLDNRELRQELGRKGRQHSQTYDWDMITEQWDQAFTRLTETPAMTTAS